MTSLQHAFSKRGSGRFQTVGVTLANSFTISILELFWWISMLTLVFSGPLSPYIGRASIFLIAGALITSSIISFFASWKGAIAIIQDVPVVILTVMAGRIASQLSGNVSLDTIFVTLIVIIMIASVGTGLVMFTLGTLQLGNLVRFFPFPVLAGFLGGTGWLLLVGGLATSLSSGSSADLLRPEKIIFWLPALLLAGVAYLFNRFFRHPLIIPLLIVIGVGLFYGITTLLGYSLADLTAAGWMIGALPDGMQIQLPELAQFSAVSWGTILLESGSLIVLMVASTIAMMLNNSGFELVVDSDFDLNRDLRMHGIANFLGGLLGGWPHYVTPGWSTLNAPQRRHYPWTGILIPIFTGILFFYATQLFAFVPRFALGAMVVYLGIIFLVEWVIESFAQLPLIEYGMVLVIVLSIAFFGLLEGVAVGLGLAVLLFAINYSRTDILKSTMTGEHQLSRVTRVPEQRTFLKSRGDQTYILQLQGYLFFGSASYLLDQVRDLVQSNGIKSIIFDFENVTGFDSTAMLSFSKMGQLFQREGISFILTGLSAAGVEKFENYGRQQSKGHFEIFETVDAGLQSVEDRQLIEAGFDLTAPQPSIEQQMQQIVPEATNISQMFELLERQDLQDGAVLMRAGDKAEDMYFVKEGLVTAQLERENGRIIRLETMGTGRSVGELGFYLDQDRTAWVVSQGPSVVYRLTKTHLKEIEETHPDIASTLHRIIVNLLADRVTHLVKVVDVLQK